MSEQSQVTIAEEGNLSKIDCFQRAFELWGLNQPSPIKVDFVETGG